MRDDATERPYAAHCQHGVSVKSCGTCYAEKEAAGSPADGPGEVTELREALEDVTMGLAIFGRDHVPGSGEVERAVVRGRAALAASKPTLPAASELEMAGISEAAWRRSVIEPRRQPDAKIDRPNAVPEATRSEVQRMNSDPPA